MLKDCHRRVERFLGLVCLVVERAQGRKLTGEERTAAEAALHCFRAGGQRHTADELESDHQEAGKLHDSVEKLFQLWIEYGSLSNADTRELLSAACQLKILYADHIKVEETEVFPLAAKTLDAGSLAAVGSEFQR
jgi:hemerythrin-like domain-containing protein